MFRSRTLFVVGAGASFEAGLPTGVSLKQEIAKKIDIRFKDGNRQISGDFGITEALQQHCHEKNSQLVDINPYLHAGWQIRDAMPQAISIDNYIDAHRGDEKIELCGKLSIARSIIESEMLGKLHLDERQEEKFDYAKLGGTWYNSFMQVLTEGVAKPDIDTIFSNVSFIVFNYDRCIEHFLVGALRNYYALEEQKAQELVRGLRIFHPYGTIGKLPWQANMPQDSVAFGGSRYNGLSLLAIARQIKTFTERMEDEAALDAIRKEVANAEIVVFLGFAFHQQNMQLISPVADPGKAKRVFSTAKGISPSDCEVVAMQIRDIFKAKPQHLKIDLRNDLTCTGLFDEYWRSLTLT